MTGTSREEESKDNLNILLLLASLVIIITGLHFAAYIIIPFLLAAFITILCLPTQRFLIEKGVPASLTVVAILGFLVIATFLLVVFVGASMNDFMAQMPFYQKQLTIMFSGYYDSFQEYGFEMPNQDLRSMLNPDVAMTMAANTIKKLSSVLTNFVLILLTVIFILLETSTFKHKILLAFGESQKTLESFEQFVSNVNHYLAIKSIFSLLTGIIVCVGLLILDVNHAILWGLIAFLLNFVPNIGSFIASVPAILIALIQHGPIVAGIVAVLYSVTNVTLGSLLEPRFMGKGLGLSPLVVFLSLIFWGVILGPVGMILSVPLTMILKLAMEHNNDTKWLAILLSSGAAAKQELEET